MSLAFGDPCLLPDHPTPPPEGHSVLLWYDLRTVCGICVDTTIWIGNTGLATRDLNKVKCARCLEIVKGQQNAY